MGNVINVGISDLNIAHPPDILATYALGSCVGICLLDKEHEIGGLVHIMLPWSREAMNSSENFRRYADTGITELIQTMCLSGAKSNRLTAKIAGGAQMFRAQTNVFNIGERNVEAVKKVLNTYRIPIIAEDTGLDFGRTLFFDVGSGMMQVKSAKSRMVVL